MANITIKNIPDEVYALIKESAKLNRRSINNEVIYRLERNLLPHHVNEEEIRYRAQKMRSQANGSLTAEEINAAINRERDDSLGY